MRKLLLLLLLSIITIVNLTAQDPYRFDSEIERFSKLSIPDGEDLVVFTGSSSIRLWENLDEDCKGMQVVNTGFGGSHMSDLLYFLDEAVLRFQPVRVYIYEGDNDIAAGKDPKAIIENAKLITNKLLESNPHIKIYFISAKPSPVRWIYKDQYIAFNTLLKEHCDSNHHLVFINVWNAMINNYGRVIPHIFVSDSLHMNREGYLLWRDIICKDSV